MWERENYADTEVSKEGAGGGMAEQWFPCGEMGG